MATRVKSIPAADKNTIDKVNKKPELKGLKAKLVKISSDEIKAIRCEAYSYLLP